MKSFWDKLPRPFFVLAPMADVTDAAFRRIIAKYGKFDVMWTEFVSADGLGHPQGRERLLIDLLYSESERPIVAQLFTAQPEKMEAAARLIQDFGFDGLDINMGCPDRTVEGQGAGAALIKNPKLAQDIIRAARRGAPKLPISVKTRIGYARDELDTWLPALLETPLSAITLHARTRQEMSKAPACWEAVSRAVKIRNEMKKETLIIGNGDVATPTDAHCKVAETGADGIMLGRAIFGNPWLFAGGIKGDTFEPQGVALKDKLKIMLEHTKLFEELLGKVKSFSMMKKHYKVYVTGEEGSNELRQALMGASNGSAVEEIISSHLRSINQSKPLP